MHVTGKMIMYYFFPSKIIHGLLPSVSQKVISLRYYICAWVSKGDTLYSVLIE